MQEGGPTPCKGMGGQARQGGQEVWGQCLQSAAQQRLQAVSQGEGCQVAGGQGLQETASVSGNPCQALCDLAVTSCAGVSDACCLALLSTSHAMRAKAVNFFRLDPRGCHLT